MAKVKSTQQEKGASPPPDQSFPAAEADHSAGSGSYQVVARRYRPKTFAELVGQPHIAQALSNALTSGRVGHAYLFCGARGVGKTSTARIFAKSLNCVDGPTLTPCGVCDSCQSVSTGEDVDVLEIDGASNRGIDEIRQLRQNVSICPSRSRYKIYIIDEVHMLTPQAFNALLKTLEEPPEHVKFIFCTTEPSTIPITILSRCQRFDFAGIDIPAIAGRLAEIAADENVTADDGVFETLARRAAGSMRDAQSLLEQLLSFAPEHLTTADVHEMLGTANDQLLFRLLDAMLQCEPARIFSELDTAASQGVDFGVLVEQLINLLRDLMVVSSGGDASLMLFCTPSQFDQARQTAAAFGLHRILAAMQILDQTHTRMRFSTQGRVLTELALIRIAHLDHFQMISVLLDRLREGQIPVQRSADSEISPAGLAQSKPVNDRISPPESPAAIRPAQRTIAPPVAEPPIPTSPSKPLESRQQEDRPDTRTPQQRLAAAVPQRIELDAISPAKAANIWSEAVDSIPGMIGTWASKAKKISFEPPNFFIVVFGNKAALDICQRESAKIQNALCQTIGQSVRIRYELDEDSKTESPQQEYRGEHRSRAELSELLKSASENPLVKQVEEVFGSELFDIR